MKKILIILALISPVIFSSCEKEITIDLPEEDPKIVIEGWIENGMPATVIITRSAPYFAPVDSATLAKSIVTNAVVTVSDGITSEQLVFGPNFSYFPFVMYNGSVIKGEAGKTYSLRVDVEGKTYTAVTTLPEPVSLDSTWFQLDPGEDSLGYVYGQGSDNGATEDYYRVFTKRIDKDLTFIPILGSVWDDKFYNGQQFVFTMYRGFASNAIDFSQENEDAFTYYKLGDVVVSKLCRIDVESYQFWRAAESEIFSGGNPFSSTTTIPTNIRGGALGVWTGYAASYDTVVCTLAK